MNLVSIRFNSVHTSFKKTKRENYVKVVTSIPVPELFLPPTITPISDSFSPICAHAWNYSQGCMTWLNVTVHYSLHRNG
jgi:hypothetical protein